MNIKQISKVLLMMAMATLYSAAVAASDKPIQHVQLPDVTSLEEAMTVFSETMSELQDKTELSATQLHEIHIITYSLEKAVAYFAENMKGEQQVTANKMTEVVELIHLGSENNRAAETKVYLEAYFKLASAFSKGL